MKKIFALVLALMLVLGMTSALADYTISVNRTNDTNPHTYKVYQIFTGTPSTDDSGNAILTDIEYGSSYPGGLTGSVPKATLDAITTARAWAAANKDNLGAEVATLDATTTSYSAAPGWYLVLDVSYTGDNADAYSAFMMEVVDADTTFTPKKEVPSVDKKVGDSDATQTEIGKELTFTLTATIPADANMASYPEYMVQFNDTMSSGLTFKSLESVTVNGSAISLGESGAKNGTYYTTVAAGDTGAWTLRIEDLKKVTGITLDNQPVSIVVTYKAVLNSNAITSSANKDTTTEAGDNNNKVTLTYSNNPDATGTGNTDTTPEDHVWIFTFESDNNKLDKNNQPVPDAGFEIYKVDTAPTTASKDAPTGTKMTLMKDGTTYYVYNANAPAGTYPSSATQVTEMVTTSTGKFDIKGLEAGNYVLYEKTVPDGYVQCNNIVITISATATEPGTTDIGKLEMTANNLNNNVINLTGNTLPETGGIGTTLFYIGGSILVLAAVILLVTKRRMSAND